MPWPTQVPRAARTAVAVLALAPVAALAEHHVALHYGGDLGLGYDSNVSNSRYDDDVRDSALALGGGHVQYLHGFGLHTSLAVRGSLQAEAYASHDALTNGKFAVTARVLHRPAGGFFTPTLAGWVSAAAWEFDSRIRDSNEYRAGVYLVQPLNTAFTARVGLEAAERVADSEVFDLSLVSAAVNVDWRLGDSTAYLGLRFQDGEVVSTATYTVHPISYSTAFAPDDAFPERPNQRAYRVDTETAVATLGFNLPLAPGLALDAQVLRADSSGRGGGGYERVIGTVGLFARF